MKRVCIFVVCIFLCACVGLAADAFSFKADRMTGGRATGRETTILIGNAEVHSDTLILSADRIEISGSDSQFIDCIGKVTGREDDKQIYFSTDRLRYNRKTKIAVLDGNSAMEDKKNEVIARGRHIEYNQDTEIAVLQIAVRLFKDEIVCRSEYAVYRRNDELLELSGFPVVYKKEDEYSADRIQVNLDTDDVIMHGQVQGSIKD
jgi:lipopolysaccharide export system protein LptA